MNTSSHILMGRFLYQYVAANYRIRLERNNYLLGNVMPDYCPSFLLRPHYLKNNAVHVQKIIRFLLSEHPSACHGTRASRLLGILCHFYADFFCYAHSDSFPAGLPEHIAYENRLNRYFAENLERLRSVRLIATSVPAADADSVYRQFETLHASYLKSHVSFGNDLLYAMTACTDLIVLISRATAAAGCEEDPYPFDQQAV